MDKCISYGNCKWCFCWSEKGCYIPWIDGGAKPPSQELLDVMYKYQELLYKYHTRRM